jgi:hypothetical protein
MTIPLSIANAYRVVNVVAHLATAEVATFYCSDSTLSRLPLISFDILHLATKLVFSFHPNHVEIMAKAASRNHIFAVLCYGHDRKRLESSIYKSLVDLFGLLGNDGYYSELANYFFYIRSSNHFLLFY